MIEANATRRRKRRQGGAGAKRRTPSSASPTRGPANLTRHLRPYELLGEEALRRIENTIDSILQDPGIDFRDDPETLAIWRQAGADVDGERVRFPQGMLRRIIQETAPRTFIQHARNPERSVQFGGDATIFAPAYGSPFVTDADRGRRYASIEDFRNLVKLAWMSPWLHHSGGTVCEPVDLPVNNRHLDMVYAHLKYSDKPFLGSITAPERAADSIEMARLVFGEQFVDRHCVILGNVNANSPLVFDRMATSALRTYATANQGTIILPFILGGAMGPVTGAGAVAQAFAEAMAGVALTQLVRPGAPAVLGVFLSSMSLRSGAPTFGTPEPALAYFVVGQLARRLGVPLRLGGSLTASKIPDAQAAQESADTLMPTLLAGAHYVLHAAGWLESALAVGYEKFVIDADRCGAMHTFAEGFATDDNALALDAFREVGPGNHFLACSHTLANYRTAFYPSDLADNQSYEQWTEEGSKDIVARANARWKAMLAQFPEQEPVLDPALDEALRDFVARRKASMADAWY
ncbi:MAG: Glycine betaine methyltransferase [Gammaproteobacteria bacterium]|nr:Glycine betaine methyltransferase [Gammaproteobacteria bacterium]